jgi:hypothetical protein
MTTTTTTCARGCRWFDHHVSDCHTEGCMGCLPRPAAEGEQLCAWCSHRASEWFAGVDRVGSLLWLEHWLGSNRGQHVRGQSFDQHVSASKEPPIPLNVDTHDLLVRLSDLVIGWESALRTEFDRPEPQVAFTLDGGVAFLRSWWPRLVRGGDPDTVRVMWDEFRDLLTDAHAQFPWRQGIRHCHGVPCMTCGKATLVVYDGDDVVTCRSCWSLLHRDVYTSWVSEVADAQADAQTIFQLAQTLDIPAKTLYTWRRRGLIRPVEGVDAKRDQLYRVADVSEVATRMREGA